MSLLKALLSKLSGKKNEMAHSMGHGAVQQERPEPRFKLGEGFYFEFDQVYNGMGGYRMINVYLLKNDEEAVL